MHTRDVVESLRNFGEFSSPPSVKMRFYKHGKSTVVVL